MQPCDSLVCFYYFVDSEEEDIYDYTHKFIVGFALFMGFVENYKKNKEEQQPYLLNKGTK